VRPITYVCAYYENPGMLREQQRGWRALPDEVKAAFHAVVVDDGSPTRPALPVVESTGIGSFRLYRTAVDVRWNWLFCRNLGVSVATTDWVLLTDIDHVVPAETLQALMTDPLDERNVYRFSRVDARRPGPFPLDECPAYKPHPNTWLMTRAMFDRIGGYDERLSGCYGTDGEFRDRVNSAARAVVIRTDVVVRYPREVIADASTVGLTRKNDPDNDRDLLERRARRSTEKAWRPLRITFPWSQQV
jgi:hypothetical protein